MTPAEIQGSLVKVQWVLLALLVVIAGALAVSWGAGFWDEPSAVIDAGPPPAPAVKSARKEPPPLDTAAWMLAHAQPQPPQAGAPQPRVDDDSACGPSGAPCADDTVCIAGACVATTCTADAGAASACALPNNRTGTCCRDRCTDLGSDSASCGQCGNPCDPGLDCLGGRCEARSCGGKMAGTTCVTNAGTGDCCRGECVDRATWLRDASNCGGCGHICATGLSCDKGACVDPTTGLLPSWNCFERGHTCPADSFCVVDACYPRACGAGSDGQLCPGSADGQIGHCCSGVCTDLFTDKDNCRACGLRCGSTEACRNGECRGQ